MCGIIGYFGEFNEQVLCAGMCAIAHRGPDDHGIFVDAAGGVGLGHQRLSIIDLSSLGHQPMQDDAGLVQLVFNGEIYNYRELRAELESVGTLFRGASDTEVILQMNLHEGQAMLPRLNGVFAIALWDTRTRTMLLARDALGVKPLYSARHRVAWRFVVRSKVFCICSGGAMPGPHRAASLPKLFVVPWEGTPLAGVRKLPPGEADGAVRSKVVRRWTWYQLPMFRGALPGLGEQEALDGRVKYLRIAVEAADGGGCAGGCIPIGRPGLKFSGGVCTRAQPRPALFHHRGRRRPEEGATGDLPYARRVAKHLNVKLDVVRIDADLMAGDLERMIVQLDEPLADPAPLNVLYISQLARESGIKVLLSGAGGDDLFTGYRRHRAVNPERLWSWMPRGARQALDRTTRSLDQRRAWSRRLAKLFSGAGLERDERIANYFVWSREADLLALYTPEFRQAPGYCHGHRAHDAVPFAAAPGHTSA